MLIAWNQKETRKVRKRSRWCWSISVGISCRRMSMTTRRISTMYQSSPISTTRSPTTWSTTAQSSKGCIRSATNYMKLLGISPISWFPTNTVFEITKSCSQLAILFRLSVRRSTVIWCSGKARRVLRRKNSGSTKARTITTKSGGMFGRGSTLLRAHTSIVSITSSRWETRGRF